MGPSNKDGLIMPWTDVLCHPKGTTQDEFLKLLELRREALDHATELHGLGQPLPVPWRHGWKAHLRVGPRDRDGSLTAHIVVTGPRGVMPYTRKVRLVTAQRLTRGLGKG